MARVKNIIVHCSDSTWGCVPAIREWHLERGWRDIGYHIVICNGRLFYDVTFRSAIGSICIGRPFDSDLYIDQEESGAHALGYNQKSLGICLIGKDQFSPIQIKNLLDLLRELLLMFDLGPEAVIGHYETQSGRDQGKTCPNIDMDLIRRSL